MFCLVRLGEGIQRRTNIEVDTVTDKEKKEYNKWLKDFGRCLSEYRKKKGLTQREAAQLADLNKRFYTDIEYGCRPVTTRTMFIICSRLEMPIPYEQVIGIICE